MKYEKALVVGGSSGSGREIALSLTKHSIDTTVIARGQNRLEKLANTEPRIKVIAKDASSDGVAAELMQEIQPDLLILCVGHGQKIAPFFEQNWEEFSGSWNADTKIAHTFMSAAIKQPMSRGGTIISFSSGAGLSGSRFSGGYAGAKRMQHFVAEYAEREAEIRNLDLAFYTIIPKQLIIDTDLGHAAGEAYARATNQSFEEFMTQWDKPLTPQKISESVISLLAKEERPEHRSFVITGTGMSEFR